MITYKTGNNLNLDQVIALYKACSLGPRRPVEDRDRMAIMLQHANLVITAWDDDELVGISRALTDWVYTTYLADLAVHELYQKKGIGKELIRHTQAATDLKTRLVLLAAPAAEQYYPKIGFAHMPNAWSVAPGENI